MTDLSYVDVRPVLAKIADLGREFVLVGGQAVNFWASFYQGRVPALAREAPFTSKDIDFCGDQRSVRVCADRLGGTPRVATFDDATPNSGTVVFVDAAGVRRTLDVVSALCRPAPAFREKRLPQMREQLAARAALASRS